MRTYLYRIKAGTQIHIPDNDEDMKILEGLDAYFEESNDVEVVHKAVSFESPMYDYKYKGIPFSMMFDEMAEETLFFVGKEYDYTVIQRLIESIEVMR